MLKGKNREDLHAIGPSREPLDYFLDKLVIGQLVDTFPVELVVNVELDIRIPSHDFYRGVIFQRCGDFALLFQLVSFAFWYCNM